MTAASSTHNRIYTVLLIVLAFFYVVSILTMIFMAISGPPAKGTMNVFGLVASIEGAFLAAIITTLILRGTAPAAGRIATKALNIIMLIAFPFGTAVAIYGLWKVDKGIVD